MKNKSKFHKELTVVSNKPIGDGVTPTFIDSDEDEDFQRSRSKRDSDSLDQGSSQTDLKPIKEKIELKSEGTQTIERLSGINSNPTE